MVIQEHIQPKGMCRGFSAKLRLVHSWTEFSSNSALSTRSVNPTPAFRRPELGTKQHVIDIWGLRMRRLIEFASNIAYQHANVP